jgi:peptidyl-prolyl cis-trans isomerase D
MLRYLSKRNRSRNALLIIFVVALVAGLVIFFIPTLRSGGSGSAEDDTSAVAKVLGRKITVKDLRQTLNAYAQQIAQGQGRGGGEDLKMVYDLYGKQVMDGLIRKELIQYVADQNNFAATDQEVQDKLKQMFNPWPGADQYRLNLQNAGTTPIEFEDNLRAQIAEEKLRSFISAAAQVSPQEVEDEYRKNNTTYTLRWVEVTPDKFKAKVPINDADLRSWFDQNKADFYVASEQRKAKYIFIDQAKAGETVQISDDELKKNFNPEASIQQVRVSQIVINLPKKAEAKTPAKTDAKADTNKTADASASKAEEEISKKVEDIYQRAQGSEGKPAEDFAKLARENSDDAKSKAQGGDIGYVNKKDKRESDDPINRVFTMKKDEVTSPIRKGDKFYILKVTDIKLPTFEESREQLLKDARSTKGYTQAVTIATEAAQKLKETKNADAVAAEINKKYNAQIATVKETPYFVEGENLPELGSGSTLVAAVFELPNQGDVTDYETVDKGFAVAQYTDKRDPHDPTFEEVKAKVEDKYRTAKAKDLALAEAKKIAQAQTPDAMKAAADAAGFKTEERAGLSANDSIGALTSEAARAPIYALKTGDVTHEPMKASDGDSYTVAGMVNRKDADMGDAFQKAKHGIEEQLLSTKRSTLFTAYLEDLQKQMKDAGKIVVYQNVIDDLIAANASPAGAQRGSGGGGNPAQMPQQQRPRRRAPQGTVTK